MSGTRLCIAQDEAADALLSRDSFALLVGMLLDQQFPMERAFAGPALIASRLGVDTLDPRAIADLDPDSFVSLCVGPPAVHRYPAAMATRIQAVASAVCETYDGDTETLWTTAESGAQLKSRLVALPGFGEQKAKIFIALLAKQLGIAPAGWQAAAGDYSETNSRRSVADVTSAESLAQVRAFKQQAKQAARESRST